jgi:hypothetical protein
MQLLEYIKLAGNNSGAFPPGVDAVEREESVTK